ncbi:hypothetical protein D3C78_1090080 [compost metagenome]
MDANQRPFMRPGPDRPGGRVHGQGQALEPAPGQPDAKQLQALEEPAQGLLVHGLQDHGEQAARAGEVAPPQRMARVAGQGRMQDLGHHGVRAQGLRQRQAVFAVLAQSHRQSAQAAQCQVHVIRPRCLPKIMRGALQQRPRPLVGRGRAQQGIGMAHDVFRCRLDGDVHAMLERLEEQRRRPGVVHHHERAGLVRLRGDGIDVLHLEGHGARRLHEDDPGVGPDLQTDPRARLRIVEAHLHAHPGQHLRGEMAGGSIDAIAHEHVVARADHGHQTQRARRQARRENDGAIPPFQLRQRRFEGLGRGGAEPAVGGHGIARQLARLPLGQRAGKNRGSAEHGNVHHARVLC